MAFSCTMLQKKPGKTKKSAFFSEFGKKSMTFLSKCDIVVVVLE
jgi:hypothetical protein